MTLRSKLSLHIYQKYFNTKDSLKSFFSKLEVIADSKAILYSVRILIVVIALAMAYVHSSKDQNESLTTHKNEFLSNSSKQIVIK